MESTNCTLCGGNYFDVARVETFSALTRIGDIEYPVITVICRSCGHVYSNPRMDQDEIENYYHHYYRQDSEETDLSPTLLGLYEADAQWITSQLGKGDGRKMLEVGCYRGDLMLKMKAEGWDVCGVEPTYSAARFARERFGLEVSTSMFEEYSTAEDPSQKFDLIVMGAVLEHVKDPTRFLLHANKLLKEGGHLFVRVPNVRCLQLDSVGDVFTLEHPNMYSPESLMMFYEKAGFNQVATTAHARWRRHIVSLSQKRVTTHKELPFSKNAELYSKVKEEIERYASFLDNTRRDVNEKIEHLWRERSVRVLLYGAGNHTEFLIRYTDIESAEIAGLVDSSPDKWGKEILGYPVYSPRDIGHLNPEAIVISSRAFQDDIYESLRGFADHGMQVIRLYDVVDSEITA